MGKSTWARLQFSAALRIDLRDEARYRDYLADPSRFAADLQPAPPGNWVAVDGIRRLPNLLDEVHRHIEDRRLNFALLVSSARKLKAAGVNLLAGSALHKAVHPLTPAEVGDDFDLDAALDADRASGSTSGRGQGRDGANVWERAVSGPAKRGGALIRAGPRGRHGAWSLMRRHGPERRKHAAANSVTT